MPSPAAAVEVKTTLSTSSSNCSSTSTYHDDIEAVLYSEALLHQRTSELGHQLARDFADKSPLVLGVLTGAFQFTGDLMRCMEPCPRGTTVNFVRASSYTSGTTSSGQVKVKVDIASSAVLGRHVILVEDIVDTGQTLTRLKAHLLEECGAATVAIVTLLDKRERRKVVLEADYVGFTCPNEFVVGYGLDFDEEYRTLPYIGILRPERYAHLNK